LVFDRDHWCVFHFKNRIRFEKKNSLIDYEIKIADRFSYENRDPILRSISDFIPGTGFQSQIDLSIESGDQLWDQNR